MNCRLDIKKSKYREDKTCKTWLKRISKEEKRIDRLKWTIEK